MFLFNNHIYNIYILKAYILITSSQTHTLMAEDNDAHLCKLPVFVESEELMREITSQKPHSLPTDEKTEPFVINNNNNDLLVLPRAGGGPQRANWLVVHSGSRITIASLSDAGGMLADGCHSTLNKDGSVITYIHMVGRCRQTSISKFMAMKFGPSSVKSIKEVRSSSCSSIAANVDKFTTTSTLTAAATTTSTSTTASSSSTVGGGVNDEIRLLARHMQEQHESFISDGVYFGILSKFVAKPKSTTATTTTTISHPSPPPLPPSANKNNHNIIKKDPAVEENAELHRRIAVMERDHVEMEGCLRAAIEDCVRVKDEMGSLRHELSKAERMECDGSELKRLRIENIEFRRLGATDKEVRRLNRELMTLQDNLDAKSNDCKTLEIMLRIADEDCARLNRAAAMAPRPSNYNNYMRE